MKKRHILKTISLIMTLAMLLGVIVAMPVTAGDTQPLGDTKVTGDWNPSAGSYVIDSKADMLAFMELGKTEKFSNKTVYLAADIDINPGWIASPSNFNTNSCAYTAPSQAWTPIEEFYGTFDGQGHSLSGLYVAGNGDSGLFKKITGATVKNFKLDNSLIAAQAGTLNNVIGFIAAWAISNVTIDNVVVDGYVRGYRAIGGFVGAMANGTTLNFNNCAFIGTITGCQGAGGFVGANNGESGKAVFTDCVNEGSVLTYSGQSANETAAFFGRMSANAELTRCVNIGSVANFIVANRLGAGNNNNATTVTTLTLTDCYAISGTTVYKAQEYFTVTGSVATVANRSSLLEKNGFDDWCLTVKGVMPTTFGIPAIVNNTISIGTANEFKYISGTALDFSGITIKLTADIDLNPGWTAVLNSHTANNAAPYKWTPAASFKGTFDGQGHSISGIYVAIDGTQNGMFKTASGATFRNIVIKNSYIASGNQGAALVGAVTGSACTFTNVYVDAIVQAYNNSNTRWYLGGLVGSQTAVGATYESCVFAGTVTYGREARGAIVGATGKNSVTNMTDCVNIGNVAHTTGDSWSPVAGLVGRWCGTGKLENCANIGETGAIGLVYLDSHGDDGANSTSSAIEIVDSYWLTGKSTDGVQVNASYNTFSNVTFTVDGESTSIDGTANITTDNLKSYSDALKLSASAELLSKNGYDAWVAYGNDIIPASVAEMLYGIEEIRMVGAQESEAVDGKFNVRFIGGIDNLNYDYVGFDITLTYGETSVKLSEEESRTHFVFTSIIADGETVSATDAELADLEITHMYVAVVNNIPTSGTATVSARAYAIKDGQRVYTGEAYTITSVGGVMAWN